MAPISMVNVPRPAKRKADEIIPSDDDNDTAKRQKTEPDQNNPQQRAKISRAAKTSRRPRKHDATTADNDVAINASSMQAPAATPTPTSSTDSNALAVQDQAPRPALTSNQSAASVASKIPLPPPEHHPDACFTQAVPPPVAPWHQSFPAPTPRLTHTLTACPIDWSKLPALDGKDIEAYELRAPWDPRPVTFDAVAKQTAYPGKGGAQPSMEAVRKRFKNANWAIFKLTGVYFQESSQGLEDWGIKRPVRSKEETTLHSTRSTNSSTTAWTTTRLHGDGEATIFHGDVVAVQLQSPNDIRPSIRICDAGLIPTYDSLVTHEELLDENNEPYIEAISPLLPFSLAAFDCWHTSVCRGPAPTFPNRTLICRQIEDDQYMLRVNSKARKASAGLMLETYVVSQTMGTTSASSMILSELRKVLNNPFAPALDDDEVYFLRYLSLDDPVREVVHNFRWRIASNPGSEYTAEDGDDDL